MSALVGTFVDQVSFDVETGKIAEFARATHATDLAHTDPETIATTGFDGPLATATHVVVAGHRRDPRGVVARLGLELSRIVVGSVSWSYDRPLTAGTHLTGTRTVIGDETREGKRGGTMRLVTLETVFTDEAGSVPARQREVLIERGRP